jgi:N-acyl-D-amino-acid deacylase
MALDLVIRHGQIIDGTGAGRFSGDIGIAGDRIAALGELGSQAGAMEIDASGCVVAPGFIDAHAHDDIAVLAEPDMPMKVSQGCATVIVGNCGFSAAPFTPGRPLPADFLLGDRSWYRFPRLKDYFAALAASPPAVNVAALVGHSTLRADCMADVGRPAELPELTAMRFRLTEAMKDGAIGFSTGLEYPSNRAADADEVATLAQAIEPFGGLYATHTRNYENRLKEAMEEALEIGRRARVNVQLSHHQGDGKANAGHSEWSLALIETARLNQNVGLDVYPYNAAATILDPIFVTASERVLVSSSQPYPEMAGRDLDAIAGEWGVDRAAAALRLAPGGAIYFCQDEGDVRRILAYPPTVIGSDGLWGGEINHPRLWGTFPRVLGHYCRDLKLFDLETAIHKMTGLTALRFGLKDRGRLGAGAYADVTIFDPDEIADAATFARPSEPSRGIRHVLVNGQSAWREGAPTGIRAGRPLKRS